MSALSNYLPSAPPPPPLLLARGDVFFTRRVPLVADTPTGDQIVLALEGMAPFPPDQLYYGHLPSSDRSSALVFAAFRRRFSAEETEEWSSAALVSAEFMALLVARPSGDGATLHLGDKRVTAIAWKQGEDLPTSVAVRSGGPELGEALVQEVLARGGLPAYAEILRLEGALAVRSVGESGFESWLGDQRLGEFPANWSGTADIRDPDFLVDRRRAQVRDLWLWRGLLASAAFLLLAALLHLGAGIAGVLTTQREAKVVAQQPEVDQIDAAQTLANRIGELSEKRLMPFEMLALINPARPDSIIFQRLATNGLLGLTVEAQAANASDVGTYANALKTQPGLSEVITRDISTRDGQTTFVLALKFNADALRKGGAL